MMGYKTRQSVRNWVTGSTNSKFVLLTLAEYADDRTRGNARPSISTISNETEICDKSIRVALHKLAINGFITVTDDTIGRPKTYTIADEYPGTRYRGSEGRGSVRDTAVPRYEIPTIIKNQEEKKEKSFFSGEDLYAEYGDIDPFEESAS